MKRAPLPPPPPKKYAGGVPTPPPLPLPLALVLALAGVAGVGYLDHLTGWQLGFSLFYLLPIGLAAWAAGARAGLAIACVSTLVWWYVERLAQPPYTLPGIIAWNALVRFGFFLVVTVLLAQLQRQMARVTRLARTDALTGLLTRGRFFELLVEELRRAQRYRHPLSVAYFDVDDFKAVNDGHGHGAGDRLLQEVADTLQRGTRAFDAVARLGGDEFIVLLPETGAEAAAPLLARLQGDLKRRSREAGVPVTFSIGVASFDRPPADPDALVGEVDRLMYEVKRAGKDGVRHLRVYAPGEDAPVGA